MSETVTAPPLAATVPRTTAEAPPATAKQFAGTDDGFATIINTTNSVPLYPLPVAVNVLLKMPLEGVSVRVWACAAGAAKAANASMSARPARQRRASPRPNRGRNPASRDTRAECADRVWRGGSPEKTCRRSPARCGESPQPVGLRSSSGGLASRRVRGVECRVSSVECRVSSVECRVSSVECRVSSVECRVSSVECRVSSVECRVYHGVLSLQCYGTAVPCDIRRIPRRDPEPVKCTRFGGPIAICASSPLMGEGNDVGNNDRCSLHLSDYACPERSRRMSSLRNCTAPTTNAKDSGCPIKPGMTDKDKGQAKQSNDTGSSMKDVEDDRQKQRQDKDAGSPIRACP